ncbi:MAG: class F sortase [bacterium]|nr:class F sortase [bacterium]
MLLNNTLKRELCIVSILGIGLSSIIIFFLIPALPSQGSFVTPQAVKGNQIVSQAVIGLPIRLKIPKIKVNAPVEHVGLTRDGAMGVPKSIANTAWFALGPRPGEIGTAVIDGHYGFWKNGKRGVFNNLHKLRKGDRIYVEDGKGKMITFVVREIKRYDPNADASEVFSSSDGKAHLNLITCEGVWDAISKNYSKRLVVFTDKE